MVAYSFFSITLITTLVLVFLKKSNKEMVLKMYYCTMLITTIVSIIIFRSSEIFYFPQNVQLYLALVAIIIIFYCLESMFINLIFNKLLILDWKFYFKGKINVNQLMISTPLLIMEEIVFRMPILEAPQVLSVKILLAVFSSICFGLVHLFFSKHNAVTKIFLGLALSVIYLISGSIITTIIIHFIYNVLTFKQQNNLIGGK